MAAHARLKIEFTEGDKCHNLMSQLKCSSMGTGTVLYFTVMCALMFLPSVLNILFEPAHEILALFVLRKLILQTRMHSHTLGLHVCEQRRLWRDCADAQARLSLRCSPM